MPNDSARAHPGLEEKAQGKLDLPGAADLVVVAAVVANGGDASGVDLAPLARTTLSTLNKLKNSAEN